MTGVNINNSRKNPRILIAPLDWGLGHATRCIPVIRFLLIHNAEIIIAAEGSIVILLQKEFPQCEFISLTGYKIGYSRFPYLFTLKILMQVPKIIMTITKERAWLNKIIVSLKIDAVISDNRFGLYNSQIPCVYITHQLAIQTGNKVINKLVSGIHYNFIKKFNACWIPDNKSENNLGGILSHPYKMPPIPTEYIGILSRFTKKESIIKYDFLLLISGPEPQRSMLETILLKQFKKSSYSFILVRGLPGETKELKIENNKATVYNHLDSTTLNEIIQQSETVIARSGYSTIMDLVKMKKKGILIATPGQAEQEYLAQYVMEKKLFYSVRQENFSLAEAINKSSSYKAETEINAGMDEGTIFNWLEKIKATLP
ncbi:MAG: glycosyltransferase [Ferruginibacter sp.]